MTHHLRSLLLSSLLAGAGVAQADATAAARALDLPWPHAVVTDRAADGTIWAGHASWKAAFTAGGATFHPARGGDRPAAAATFVLRRARAGGQDLRVASSAPRRHGERITYEHGDVVEHFDLRPDGIEQRFELATLPCRDGLRLEVGVTTTLPHRADGAEHAFVDSDGGVRYGRAVAIDAAGRRTDVPVTWQDGALVLDVPGPFLATAELPLLVDPLIGTIAAVTTNQNVALAAVDLAWDASLASWFAVYERAFSSIDHDVFVVRLDAAMQPQGLVTIDYTAADWTRPRIACLEAHDKVGVVAQSSTPANPVAQVQLRTFTAGAAPVVDAVVTVSPSAQYARQEPDIGGDANPNGPSQFLIAWESFAAAYNASDTRIALVDANGVVGATQTLNSGITFGRHAAVSKTCGTIGGGSEGWAIVQRAVVYQQTVGQLRAWLVGRNGVVRDAAGTYLFAQLSGLTANAGSEFDVSAPTDHDQGRTFLCVERRLDPVANRGALVGHVFDSVGNVLVAGAPLLASNLDREHPAVDCDGVRFALASATVYSATDSDVRCDTIARIGTQLAIQDTDIASTSGDRDDQPAVCARSGSRNTYGIAWVHANTVHALQGQVYRGTATASVATRTTNCGGITIGHGGALALGETFTVSVAATSGLTGFLVGTPVSLPVPGCAGCVQGADGLLLAGSPLAVTVPPTPALVGAVLACQGVRYDPAVGPCLGMLAFTNTLDVAIH